MLNFTVAGRLTKDAQTRTAGSDTVTGFTVAVDTGFGDKKKAYFIDCSWWGKRGEKLCQYLTKGTPVTVTGEGGMREWESNGKSGVSLTIRVNDATLQGSKRDSDSGNQGGGNSGSYGGGNQRQERGGNGGGWEPPQDLSDDIPFALCGDTTDALLGKRTAYRVG